ncbi:type II toxin-antitoxin system death-on-curing family toxin [Pleurocapsa sp. PCC 7319]|uniref:type II toxin-antitoxin system death-on-curing family toxin n=1 Tax=Pleurocapsa sp. PCC 7319 TaxID=118161 RepID=UPI00034D0F22|nr:type II toxin-antitoxin system death-on-curing family toxin [Pleurocapsa sp. PCC 7319]
MSNIRFLTVKQVKAIHQQQILNFGGSPGILDESKLESAVFRAQNLANYNPEATIYDLAATIGWGIANNHSFVDGNKRTAFVVMAVFLQINGILLTASEVDVVHIMLAVASNQMSQEQLSDWLNEFSVARF